MAATSEEGLESLVGNFDQIYEGYKVAVLEIHSLRSSYHAETQRREALESNCSDLKTDNERLRKLHTDSLNKLAKQIEYLEKCRSLEEELKEAEARLLNLEDEHRRALERVAEDSEIKINDLEGQISCSLLQQAADRAMTTQLQQELTAYKTQIDILESNSKKVTTDYEFKYHQEIQDLKDWIVVEQEEKKELQRRLQNSEDEMGILRKKLAEQQRESISIRHVETLKQKIMKLRKENESLKKQLHSSEVDGA